MKQPANSKVKGNMVGIPTKLSTISLKACHHWDIGICLLNIATWFSFRPPASNFSSSLNGGRISVVCLLLLWPYGGLFLRCRPKIWLRSSQTRPDCPVTPATKKLVFCAAWWRLLDGWLTLLCLFARLFACSSVIVALSFLDSLRLIDGIGFLV